MFKEIVICIAIIMSIISLDIFTQNFTKKTVAEITESFNSLKEAILDEDREVTREQAENITKDWEQRNDKLAYFIEHDELEKVSNAIVEMKSHIETETYADAIAELEEGIFVLEHIQERNTLNLQNIF